MPKVETALATIPEFALAQLGPGEMVELIQDNLGGDNIRAFDLTRLKIPGGGATTNWTVPTLEGEEEMKEIVGVVVYHDPAKTFWKVSFDASGGGTPPDCAGSLINGMWIGAGDRDGTGDLGPHDCATCAHNQFGTAQAGKGRGKACNDTRVVCILTPESVLPKLIVMPPTSAAKMKKFLMGLISERKRISEYVICLTLSKEKNANGIIYCEVNMRIVGKLQGPALAQMQEYCAMIKPLLDSRNLAQEAQNEPSGESFTDTYTETAGATA